MNSVAFMDKKAPKKTARRPLTAEELAACARFAELLEASKFSQETLAPELGVTAGAVGHWARGLLAIPLRRAAEIAAAIGGKPEEICVEWREAVAPYLGESQSLRLDHEMLSASIKLVRLAFENLETEHDPEEDGLPTALAYAYLRKRKQRTVTAENVVDFTKYLRRSMQEGNDDRVAGIGGASKGNRRSGAEREAG